jgi:hypothetical protein
MYLPLLCYHLIFISSDDKRYARKTRLSLSARLIDSALAFIPTAKPKLERLSWHDAQSDKEKGTKNIRINLRVLEAIYQSVLFTSV